MIARVIQTSNSHVVFFNGNYYGSWSTESPLFQADLYANGSIINYTISSFMVSPDSSRPWTVNSFIYSDKGWMFPISFDKYGTAGKIWIGCANVADQIGQEVNSGAIISISLVNGRIDATQSKWSLDNEYFQHLDVLIAGRAKPSLEIIMNLFWFKKIKMWWLNIIQIAMEILITKQHTKICYLT